jgi:ribose-phosphate pyrophosphokinase
MYSGSGIIKIFAGSSGRNLALKMCEYLGTQIGDSKTIEFSDGNLFVRVNESIRNKDVFIVQPIGADPNNEFVELLFWIDAFKRASVNSVTAIIPYFSYAKGDKKDEPRVSIRARVCAETIELAGADRIITMDLHSSQVQGFFKKPLDHLYAHQMLCEYIQRAGLNDNLVVVSPDAGFAKRAHQFAETLDTPVAIGDKTRYGHDENAHILDVIGNVDGKNCLIVDDFTISGNTLINMAISLKARGAHHIYCALSHINLKADGVERINESPIEMLVVTDTVDCPAIATSPKFKVISVAPLFAETARLIHDRESVGHMFEHIPEKVLKYGFRSDTQIELSLMQPEIE